MSLSCAGRGGGGKGKEGVSLELVVCEEAGVGGEDEQLGVLCLGLEVDKVVVAEREPLLGPGGAALHT